jgi:hypothetical protein
MEMTTLEDRLELHDLVCRFMQAFDESAASPRWSSRVMATRRSMRVPAEHRRLPGNRSEARDPAAR